MSQQRPPDHDPLASEIDDALEGVNLQDIDDQKSAANKRAGPRPKSSDTSLKRGTIVGITGDDVFVEIGPRMQGVISLREFEKPPAVGETYDFNLHGREDELWVLSRKDAQAIAAWDDVEQGSIVKARVTGQNTGGLELKVGPLSAFMPASQVGLRHDDDLAQYLTQTLTCQVLEVDRDRKRILLSRRAVLEREQEAARKETVGKLSTGQVIQGKVTRVEAFGAFVDIGAGMEGLVHVSNLSRRRVENPNDVVHPGQRVEVQVLEIKDGGKRIGLGMKQLEADPWLDVAERYASDAVVRGKVTRLTEFGAFVELEPGLEGLLHVSQLGKDRVRRARDVLKVGEELSVRIVAVEPARQRLSLSRLDARGAVLGSEDSVESSVIDEALQKSAEKPIGTNLGNLFRKAIEPKP